TIATDHVTASVSEVGVVEPKLRVIEDVERLGAELQNTRFTDRKMLEQAHVKIQASGIVQEIATSVSEGQAARRDERARIPKDGPEALGIVPALRRIAMRSRRDVRIRPRSNPVCDSGVIQNRD